MGIPSSNAPVAPAPGDVDFANKVGRLVALGVVGALTRQELQKANDRLAAEKLYLEEEIRIDRRTDEVVGAGTALREVLRQVEVVACSTELARCSSPWRRPAPGRN